MQFKKKINFQFHIWLTNFVCTNLPTLKLVIVFFVSKKRRKNSRTTSMNTLYTHTLFAQFINLIFDNFIFFIHHFNATFLFPRPTSSTLLSICPEKWTKRELDLNNVETNLFTTLLYSIRYVCLSFIINSSFFFVQHFHSFLKCFYDVWLWFFVVVVWKKIR